MAVMPFYAHTLEGKGPEHWEPLERHLREVAKMAGDFAAAFGAKDWGRLAGLWHDLGKYSREFQEYLRKASGSADPHGEDSGSAGRVDHSTAGAQHSAKNTQLGPLLAYIIAGHHAGLADGIPELRERLAKTVREWEHFAPDEFKAGVISMPNLTKSDDAPAGLFRLAFFLRMVFSALVDADFLCTEAFMSPEQTELRHEWPDDVLEKMETALVRHLDQFGEPKTHVDHERLHVRRSCEAAAGLEPGFFDLTVPTGGGKTLSSLLFALRHARRHGIRRVVCAIPFTSIIEQNADVYREVFHELSTELGQDIVLEHHSNLQPQGETTRNRLAAENWDAPLIVTTNVQLFESLFACRTSRCRKLHRLAKSVIVLDEVQTLPVRLLRPVLAALRCLVLDYRCSVVLCTATQPALERRDGFDPGIPHETIRSIIPDRERLYESLRRTKVEVLGSQRNAELMTRVLAERGGSLVVVNTTKAAREFYTSLGDMNTARFHLSARMCPEHRSTVLAAVKSCLNDKKSTTLVSTQLIEAGVDVSFPAVFRAECGLDSLVQAAGRCNRNGELRDESGAEMLGRVYAFEHDGYGIPRQLVELRDSAADATQVIPTHLDDILSLSAIERYFRLHIWTVGQRTNEWDQPDVMGCFPAASGKDWQFTLQFREADKRFQMIPQVTNPLIVPWGDRGRALCEELRSRDKIKLPPSLEHYRRAQRFTVQVYDWEWQQLLLTGRVESLHDGAIHILIHPENDYDEAFGLRPPSAPNSPTAFMV